jgi:hypothetical protein
MCKKWVLLVLTVFLVTGKTYAQSKPVVELFGGSELSYADVNFLRLYNLLVNLTPSAKVHLGNEWEANVQTYLPILNEGYPRRDDMFRLNMANISKVLRFEDSHQYFKFTAGLFGNQRWGGDIRWMYPINSWLMVHGRAGLTNYWALGADLEGNSESDFTTTKWNLTGTLGLSVWLKAWNTELRAVGGRYLNKNHGVEGEVIRHFKHCSVSFFAQLHEKTKNQYVRLRYSQTTGFRIIIMFPQLSNKKNNAVVFRPASNFRLTYNAQADGVSMQKYNTDPEENERTYPIRIPWGMGNIE